MYAFTWILRNTDLKYSNYYSLLTLGSRHVRFKPAIQYSNSCYYTNIYSVLLVGLAGFERLLNTACNFTGATYKRVGMRGVKRVERVGGLMMSLDTADQVVCTVGQTDGHSSPDHTTSREDIQWNRIGSQAALLMPLMDLTGYIMVFCDLTGSKKGHL